jgi:2'-hydroxyisoflavone reductase
MTTSRRDFVRLSTTAGAALGALGGGALDLAASEALGTAPSPPPRRLKILVLGGTGFIGPHEIRFALSRGHEVTMFNRGRSNPELFPDVERLIGDRAGELDSLRGRQWDVVVDNSGFYPRHARLSAELLEPNVGMYLFVSSISAYDPTSLQPLQHPDEAPYATMEDPTDESESPYGPSYGARKALCEMEIMEIMGPDRTTLVRPGLITGPGDPTDRLRHWFTRVERGGEILVPGEPSDPVQWIDARDLSAWIVRLMEDGTPGRFNGVGPRTLKTAADLVHGMASAIDSERTFTFVPWSFMQENEIPAGYLPMAPPVVAGYRQVYNANSVESGLSFRTLAEITRDMYDEYVTIANAGYEENWGLRAGLSREDEAAALELWRQSL